MVDFTAPCSACGHAVGSTDPLGGAPVGDRRPVAPRARWDRLT